MCPTKKDKCGTNVENQFNNEGETAQLRVENLSAGETCVYKIKAECGAPGIQKTSGVDKTSIATIEYNEDNSSTSMDNTKQKP